MTTNTYDAKFLFGQLAERMKSQPAEVQQRIAAHIQAVSGHSTLVAYHNNGATDEEKCLLYGDCLRALIKGEYQGLKGQVSQGQAPKKKPEGKIIETPPKPKPPESPPKPEPTPEPPKPKESDQNPIRVQSDSPPDLAAVIAAAIAGALPKPQAVGGVSEERIRAILAEEFLKRENIEWAFKDVMIEVTRLMQKFEEDFDKRLHEAKFELLKTMDKRYNETCRKVAEQFLPDGYKITLR